MNDQIRNAGQWAWALVGLTVVVLILATMAWLVRAIWPPLVLAGSIVYVLNPLVTTLQNRHVPRLLGAALSYTLVIAFVAVAGTLVAPIAVDQADGLADEWPALRADVEGWVDDLATESRDWIVSTPTVEEIRAEFDDGNDSLGETISRIRNVGGKVIHWALIFVLGPILAFYLLVDLPRLGLVAESLIPPGLRDEVHLVAGRLNRALGGFLRGQLLVALIVGVMVSAGLVVIGLDFWLIVGMIAGISNVVPLVGPWVGGVPGVVIALSTGDERQAFWVVLVMVGAQQIDNHFISPLVMQRTVKLHPAVVILALLVGGSVGGIFGLFLAVPATAVLKIVAGHLWRTYVLKEPIEEVAERTAADDALPRSGVVSEVLTTELREASSGG